MPPLQPGVAPSGLAPQPETTIAALSPRAWWKLNEASGTLVNSGSLASRNGTGTSITYGQAAIATRSKGTCVSFNGSSSYIQVTDAIITGTTPTYSFGFWYSTSSTSLQTIFQQKDATSSGAGFRVITNGTTLTFYSYHTDGSYEEMSWDNPIVSNGSTVYVGVTADPTFFTLYINGGFANRIYRSAYTYVSGSDVFMGRSHGAFDYFTGKLSNLFITNTELSFEDHRAIYFSSMNFGDPPLGDNFLDAIPLALDTPIVSTTVGSTTDIKDDPYWDYISAEIPAMQTSMWFKFDPTSAPGILRVSSTLGMGVSVYKSYGIIPPRTIYESSSGGLSNSFGNYVKELLLSNLESAEQVFYISVGNNMGVSSSTAIPGAFTIEVESIPAVAANDAFASASTINVASAGSVTGTTLGATIQDSQECVMTGCAEHTMWYKFTADATGNITLDTCVGTEQYQYYGVAIWDATADAIVTVADVDWTAPLAADQYGGPDGCGEITVAVVNGHVYYVQVSQGNFLTAENYTLSWTDIT